MHLNDKYINISEPINLATRPFFAAWCRDFLNMSLFKQQQFAYFITTFSVDEIDRYVTLSIKAADFECAWQEEASKAPL